MSEAVPSSWRPALDRSLPASLDFTLASGDDAGSQRLALSGTSGVARLDLSIAMAGGLGGIAEDHVQVVGSLEAEDGSELVRQLGEGATGGSGDPRGFHQVLGERLRRFDACGAGVGTDDQSPLSPEPIPQAHRERHFGADDREVDAMHVGRIGNTVDVIGRDREVGREFSGARVAGCTVDGG